MSRDQRNDRVNFHHIDSAHKLQQRRQWLIWLKSPAVIVLYSFVRSDQGELKMCRKIILTLAALSAGVGLAMASAPASAQALRTGAAQFARGDAVVEQVQFRRRYYRGYRGYRRGIDPGAAAVLGIIGLAAGAIASSALAPPPYVVGDPNWIAYCSSKYRSFDPASGTYLGYDGFRHYCR